MPKKTPELLPPVIPSRPNPPADMPADAASLWREIVSGYPVGHFTPANLTLLDSLCRSHVLIRACDKAIEADGAFVDGKAHPAIAVRVAERRVLMSLATKLRLPISSTMRSETAAARADHEKQSLRKPWERA